MGENVRERDRRKMWRVVKNLYREVGSCVRLGERETEWFTLRGRFKTRMYIIPLFFFQFS